MTNVKLFMENFYILDDGRVRQFLITGEEALLIDTGFADGQVHQAVRRLTSLPVRVVLTHGDVDHAGGLKDFGEGFLHRADWHLVKDRVSLKPLEEGDATAWRWSRYRAIHTGAWRFWTGRESCFCPATLYRRAGRFSCLGIIAVWTCT